MNTTIDPDQLTRELEQFTQRFQRGMTALAQLAEPRVGATEKDAIFADGKLVLYRYRPFAEISGKTRIRTPLLICYALINRPYVMDLQPNRSLVRELLRRGHDVYLIDWGYPDGADRFLGMQDYVQGYLPHCVDQVRKATGASQVNLLGVCQGGTLSLCYTALYPRTVRNLITMVTPVDFRTPENLLTKWTEHVDLDTLAATTGNVPGEALNALFLALMPFRLTSQKYVDLLDQIDNPQALENFLRMEKWIFDSPDQPGEMFRQFMTWMVKENRLVRGTLEIGGRLIDLRSINMPVFNIYASQDHLVPPTASTPLAGLTSSRDYNSYAFQGGHIGIYVSGSAQKDIPDRVTDWLRTRDGGKSGAAAKRSRGSPS
jgi:polyhydroxyalkanoate synthase